MLQMVRRRPGFSQTRFWKKIAWLANFESEPERARGCKSFIQGYVKPGVRGISDSGPQRFDRDGKPFLYLVVDGSHPTVDESRREDVPFCAPCEGCMDNIYAIIMMDSGTPIRIVYPVEQTLDVEFHNEAGRAAEVVGKNIAMTRRMFVSAEIMQADESLRIMYSSNDATPLAWVQKGPGMFTPEEDPNQNMGQRQARLDARDRLWRKARWLCVDCGNGEEELCDERVYIFASGQVGSGEVDQTAMRSVAEGKRYCVNSARFYTHECLDRIESVVDMELDGPVLGAAAWWRTDGRPFPGLPIRIVGNASTAQAVMLHNLHTYMRRVMEIARSGHGRNDRRNATGMGWLRAQIWSDPSVAVNSTAVRTARVDRPMNEDVNMDQVRRDLREVRAVAGEFAVNADRSERIRDAMSRVNLDHARRERAAAQGDTGDRHRGAGRSGAGRSAGRDAAGRGAGRSNVGKGGSSSSSGSGNNGQGGYGAGNHGAGSSGGGRGGGGGGAWA